ncbi:hypothetical protein JTB14_036240 [Gonioctena quinquepunctata]|nr:hypothetical protein JTB14_036240 [Gonioctena quinquepunctata]
METKKSLRQAWETAICPHPSKCIINSEIHNNFKGIRSLWFFMECNRIDFSEYLGKQMPARTPSNDQNYDPERHSTFQEVSAIIGPDPLQRLGNLEYEEHRVSHADGYVNDNEIIFTEDDSDLMPILSEGDLNSLESTFNSLLLDEIDYSNEESEEEEANQNDSRNPTNNVSVLSGQIVLDDIEEFLLKMKTPERKNETETERSSFVIASTVYKQQLEEEERIKQEVERKKEENKQK